MLWSELATSLTFFGGIPSVWNGFKKTIGD